MSKNVKLTCEILTAMDNVGLVSTICKMRNIIVKEYKDNIKEAPQLNYAQLVDVLTEYNVRPSDILKSCDSAQIQLFNFMDVYENYAGIYVESLVIMVYVRNGIFVNTSNGTSWDNDIPSALTIHTVRDDMNISIILIKYDDEYAKPEMFSRDMITHELVHSLLVNVSTIYTDIQQLSDTDEEFIADYIAYYIEYKDGTLEHLKKVLPTQFHPGVYASYLPYLGYMSVIDDTDNENEREVINE